MHIYSLLDQNVLGDLIAEGFVKEQFHPSEPLAILNYTDKAQLASATELWDHPYYGDTVRQCRGLIYNTAHGEVAATPWPKFFNYGQGGADKFELEERVLVTDKVDGSLGICYWMPTKQMWAIATRGSFTSEQAVHATELLWSKYKGWAPMPDETVLFEIVYPENRIVLNYGSDDHLVLLGSVEMQDGWISGPEQAANWHGWVGPRAHTFVYETLADALKYMNRENAEGYVVISDSGDSRLNMRRMIKLKQEDYKALHAARFGLNQRSVYNALMVGVSGPDEQYGDTTLDRLIEALPDEFHEWVLAHVRQLKARVDGHAARIRETYYQIMRDFPWPEGAALASDRFAKKQFAEIVSSDPDAWAYFLLFQGRGEEIELKLWKKLEPDGRVTPNSHPIEEV